MRVLIQDTHFGHSCLKTTKSVSAEDAVQDVYECLLGMGYAKESILNAMEEVLESHSR